MSFTHDHVFNFNTIKRSLYKPNSRLRICAFIAKDSVLQNVPENETMPRRLTDAQPSPKKPVGDSVLKPSSNAGSERINQKLD